MPLFRVAGGRSVAVHPSSPAREPFDTQVPALLAAHLDVLLGEPLLLVRVGQGPDEPSLLAVDGAGRPVVVEAVAELDDAALLAALRSAGRAGRLGPQELARLHHGGAERFDAQLAALRGAGPGSPSRVGGRLVLVVAEVLGVEDALDHLRQDGRVEVLRVGVLPGPDQDRWIDVSPLARTLARVSDSLAEPTGGLVIAPPPPGAPSTPLPRRASALHRAGLAQPAPTIVPGLADRVRPAARRPPPDLPYAFTGRLPALAYRPGPDERLAHLAAARGGAVVLVWHRGRRGTSFEALLHPDGMIELVDGTRVTDPSAAAEMASGSQVAVDGWQVWRLDSAGGPTLAEACPELSPSRTPMSIA